MFNHGFKKRCDKKEFSLKRMKIIFFTSTVSESIDHFNSKGNKMIQKLYLFTDSKKPICIFDEFNRMALDAIAKVYSDANVG